MGIVCMTRWENPVQASQAGGEEEEERQDAARRNPESESLACLVPVFWLADRIVMLDSTAHEDEKIWRYCQATLFSHRTKTTISHI